MQKLGRRGNSCVCEELRGSSRAAAFSHSHTHGRGGATCTRSTGTFPGPPVHPPGPCLPSTHLWVQQRVHAPQDVTQMALEPGGGGRQGEAGRGVVQRISNGSKGCSVRLCLTIKVIRERQCGEPVG